MKKLFFFIFFLWTPVFIAQENFNRFSDYIQMSLQENVSANDSLVCQIPSNLRIAELLTKNDWKVADLEVIDCIIKEVTTSKNNIKNAMLYYLKSKAYSDFDDSVKNEMLRKAFFIFKENQDVDGQFFSLNDLFLNLLSDASVASESTYEETEYKLNELKPLYKNSDFIPTKITFKETKLRKAIRLRESLSDAFLFDIESYAKESENAYPRLVRSLYSSIAIAHQQKGNTEKSLALKRKALRLANPEKQDYPSYLINIAGSYFHKREIDSAMVYLQKAYKMTPENPTTIYSLILKRNIESNIASLYRQKQVNDSAYIYMTKSKLTSDALNSLQINEKKLFAEKKFEVQKRDLEIAQRDIELLKRDKQRIYLITGLLLVVVVLIVVGLFLKKSRKLHRQAKQLATNRERLLQIVSHDLISPLQSFSMTASTIPKLIKRKRFEEVEVLQKSLSTTIIALQDMLKNLFAWNEKMKSNTLNSPQEVRLFNISDGIISILNTYKGLAEERNIEFSILLAKDEIWINTIPTQLLNLLRNLIYNAVKHSPNNSYIDIELKEEENSQIVFVCSNLMPETKKENAEKLVKLINSKKLHSSFADGLGMEIIFYAVQIIEIKLEAKIENNKFTIKCKIPTKINKPIAYK
ncbi:MAG: hypothetical protein LAT51_11635 [Flavobacteriaceae bacterium]|nr:hypothetical protein [Flavobacteriaceae bacterium]